MVISDPSPFLPSISNRSHNVNSWSLYCGWYGPANACNSTIMLLLPFSLELVQAQWRQRMVGQDWRNHSCMYQSFHFCSPTARDWHTYTIIVMGSKMHNSISTSDNKYVSTYMKTTVHMEQTYKQTNEHTLYISRHTSPTTSEVVVAIAGMILPAINLLYTKVNHS